MTQLLTPEQLDRVRSIIQKHHAALIMKTIGLTALTPTEKDILESAGIGSTELNGIRDAYALGQLMAKLDAKALDLSMTQVQAMAEPLSGSEESAISSLEIHAGAHIRHLGARVVQQMEMLVFREDANMRASLLNKTKETVKENIVRRESIGKLTGELRKVTGDWERDWNRVALTEKVTAMNNGQAHQYQKTYGDPWVFKRPQPDACEHCKRLHIGPDGHPRMFPLSTLQNSGTNAGRKTNAWEAVVGATHPHCQCTLSRVPPGWGFDEESTLVPGGTHGTKYESEEVIEKSLKFELELQKAFAIKGRVSVCGLPIAIEQNVGDLRHWKDENGNEGATRMMFAYGYVEGTLGPDGDEYDVYIGPDPQAPFVYIVHQKNTKTGEYDEDKAMVGFPDPHTAKQAYLLHYDSPEFYGSMSIITIEEFKAKLLDTRTKGSLQSDGMIKALHTEASGAQFSVMGNRAVSETAGGVNISMGLNYDASQRDSAHPATPASDLITEATRMKLERMYAVRVSPEIYERESRPEQVFTFDPDAVLDAHENARKDLDKNRFFLDEEISRKLSRVSPNYSDPEKERSDLTSDQDDVKLKKSAAFYLGPRGGKWADPGHKIPWKERKMDTPQKKTPLKPRMSIEDVRFPDTWMKASWGGKHEVSSKDELYQKAPRAHQYLASVLKSFEGKGFSVSGRDKLQKDLAVRGKGVTLLAPIKQGRRAEQRVNVDFGGDWSQLRDVVRGSIAVDTLEDVQGVINHLAEQGVEMARKPANRISQPVPGNYRDMVLYLKAPEGMMVELQIHLKPMLYAKEVGPGHKIYEEWREIDAVARPEPNDIQKARMAALIRKSENLYNAAWDAVLKG